MANAFIDRYIEIWKTLSDLPAPVWDYCWDDWTDEDFERELENVETFVRQDLASIKSNL